MKKDPIRAAHPPVPLIFVVEDEKDIALLIAHTLEGGGFKSRVFLDGDMVVEAAREQVPVLILLDLMLPGVDGLEISSLPGVAAKNTRNQKNHTFCSWL